LDEATDEAADEATDDEDGEAGESEENHDGDEELQEDEELAAGELLPRDTEPPARDAGALADLARVCLLGENSTWTTCKITSAALEACAVAEAGQRQFVEAAGAHAGALCTKATAAAELVRRRAAAARQDEEAQKELEQALVDMLERERSEDMARLAQRRQEDEERQEARRKQHEGFLQVRAALSLKRSQAARQLDEDAQLAVAELQCSPRLPQPQATDMTAALCAALQVPCIKTLERQVDETREEFKTAAQRLRDRL
jgi:hypothetical protein